MRDIDERMQNVSCISRTRIGKRVAQMVEQSRFTEALVIDNPSIVAVDFQLEHLEGEITMKADTWNFLMADDEENIANTLGIRALPKLEPERVAILIEELGRRKHIVQVHPLSDKESMNLFLEIADHGVLKISSLEDILRDIVQECDGLPFAIAIITGSMKGVYDVTEWWNALRESNDYIVQVPPPSDEESMNLFLEHVEHGVLKVSSLKDILCDIVQECDELPFAIVVLTRSMKGVYDVAECRNALRELSDHRHKGSAENNGKLRPALKYLDSTAIHVKSSFAG
ncbi:hypothetical protein V6N11_023460 [Hibiscus sabdariffa]|uniref:NB-ARC domain-containing protein n=1 Tax=Hibiscus sabdariffa TaxID=183260 RepID=A0ABR2TMI0_9ROSI